ncbi:hypothetical protein [Streptomyces reniochalinae]|uniref:Uncharacterized protein n=1 Tax=Streptomyces reniochalinae TaxID=2250578 RepID=A0A367E795_9ACTN|nr:hypothetical protein [Streptomyces reniochalinae]RCG13881.1 hypothetical protein DQ392_30725 [Streptomyces reniochalinae]
MNRTTAGPHGPGAGNASGHRREPRPRAADAFDKVRAILLGANRLGIFDGNPMEGVVAPQHDPARIAWSRFRRSPAEKSASHSQWPTEQ